MVRCVCGLVGVTLLAGSLAAQPLQLPVLQVGFKTYTNVVIIGANQTDLYFRHSQGLTNVKLKYLDPDLQKQFNYDPDVAAATEAQQLADDARYRAAVGEAWAAEWRRRTEIKIPPEERLLDPVTDKTFLHKKAPPLEVEKWLSEKPDLADRPVLIVFWVTTSPPCLRAIPELNALHKKLGDKIAIVALSPEKENTVIQMDGPRIEYYSAVDTQARLQNALGVTTVPHVVLIDASGLVRYLGHPSALTEKFLEALATRAAG
jgi:cytochrome c biogenesis protein CcmG/thiol:disulfide interchange protein DsbE